MAAIETGRERPGDAPGAARLAAADRFGLALGGLLLCCCAFRLFLFVQDDAFITYRYAWHLRHGFGPVFNPGERTEGYSCPLYMTFAAAIISMPGGILLWAKVAGLVFALGTLWTVSKLAREMDLPPAVRGAVPVLLGANASFALSAVDGMETSLQAFLVTLACLRFCREQRSAQGWTSALILLAAALNRAEGAIYFLAALVPFAFGLRTRGVQRRDLLWLAAFLLPMTLFLLWRHAYYGDWLPNTVYAKSMPLETALDYKLGPAYLLRTIFVNLNSRVPALLVSLLLWFLVAQGAAAPAMRRGGALFIPLGVLAQMLIALRAGGDWMIGWRYMMAAVPLWTLLLSIGMHQFVAEILSKSAARPKALVSCYVASTALFLGIQPEFAAATARIAGATAWSAAGWTCDTRKMVLTQNHLFSAVRMADGLNATMPAGASAAYSEMGVTPFFTPKIRWLDTDGLTDREAGHLTTAVHGRMGTDAPL